jgi:antitoxin (DNA-binding transcriptional repressor) of toxin-antitoxin stability system
MSVAAFTMQGEEVIISKAGKPIAKLVAYSTPKPKKRLLGHAKGLIKVNKSFFNPLPKEILDSYYL